MQSTTAASIWMKHLALIALHGPPCCALGQRRGDGVIGRISKGDANHLRALDPGRAVISWHVSQSPLSAIAYAEPGVRRLAEDAFRFKKSLSMSGEVGRRAGVHRVSDPDWLTSQNDKALGRDTPGLIFRIIVVVFLGLLFWQAIIAAGRP